MSHNTERPIVYSCSGCSNVAQLANHVALELDRQGLAEMSCIAGIGGKVKPLLKLARSRRPIIALDGCALHCTRHCLEGIDVTASLHLTLTDMDVRKVKHQDFTSEDFQAVFAKVSDTLLSIT